MMATLITNSLLPTVTLWMSLANAGRSLATLVGDKGYCYASDTNPYLKFSSKTAYEFVYNKKGISELTGCQAVQVWLVSRHGTRFPSLKDLKSMRELEPLRDRILRNSESELCTDDVANLGLWSLKVADADERHLTEQGRKDMLGLGRRVASYFPHLFRSGYNKQKHIFRHTNSKRTAESATCFAEGAFGKKPLSLPAPVPKGQGDPLLSPYEHCAAWRALEEPKRQYRKFQNSHWMQEVVDRVARRTGLQHSKITSAQVLAMYNACRFEKAWHVKKVSPWCAFFRKEDLEVLEYGDDLSAYYTSGPGTNLNFLLACPMLQNMVNNFRAVVMGVEAAPSALLYFSHDLGVQMLAARLNLTTDDPLLDADSWPEPASSRRFRTSEAVPFAANIMAVLYKCTQGNLKVAVYHQEHLVRVPGCKDSYCDWQEFEHMFGPIADDHFCTDMSFCNDTDGSKLKNKINKV